MQRTLVLNCLERISQKVKLCGWVNRCRDHGRLVFIDLRDRSGIVQVVIASNPPPQWSHEFTAGADTDTGLRPEDVVEITGKVVKRLAKVVNPNLATGSIEVQAEKVKILARAADLPLPIDSDGYEVNEETRLKYRYLDLRRPRLVKNLRLRHQAIKFIRDWLDNQGFVEVETPILTKSTPEGARDFVVPARLQPGKFYALPQSPQQYKQLLMVAGLERYYQIARCFRDEDPRADRAYGEFTQLDLEMSFTSQKEILNLTEELFTALVTKLMPAKKISQSPFPRLTYQEVVKKYQTDKPDLRKDKNNPDELAFCFIVDFPLFEKTPERAIDSMHHPFTAPKDADIPLLAKEPLKVRSWQHDFVLNGFEVGGGSVRITDSEIQKKVFQILGHTPQEIEQKFGHLLEAFNYGVPPHAGIAPGIDRFLMVVLAEPSLREVIAFPMTAGGRTSVMQAPSALNQKQLKELGLKLQ